MATQRKLTIEYVNLKFLAATALILVVSGCAKDARIIAPDYVSPLEYQKYTCAQLGAELSAMMRWAQDKEETKLKLLTNEIEVISQTAKEKNCEDLIHLFEEAQEEVKKEVERRITIDKVLTVLSCLRALKPYRQPHFFAMTLIGCAMVVEISD